MIYLKPNKHTWLLKHNRKLPKQIYQKPIHTSEEDILNKVIKHYKNHFPNMPYKDFVWILEHYNINRQLMRFEYYITLNVARHKHTNYDLVKKINHDETQKYYNKEAMKIIKQWRRK